MKRREREAVQELSLRLREHDLEPPLVGAIEKLPPQARHSMLRWIDDTLTRLDESPARQELTPLDAAFHAVDAAVTRERTRLARELHDGIAADLATALALFKHYFETAGGDREAGEQSLHDIFHILEGLLETTRNTLRTMRPRRLGSAGLVDELRLTADEYGRVHGIRVEIWTSGSEAELTATQREVVFHIIREALTNVRRHSGALVCRVRLALAARPFLIEVTDEGRGFDAPGGSGYGMVGMRERAAGIGGRLEVVTTAGKGTTVFLFGPDQ